MTEGEYEGYVNQLRSVSNGHDYCCSAATTKALPGTRYYDLFQHMHDKHGLILLETELIDIIHVVDRMKCESQSPKNPSPAN